MRALITGGAGFIGSHLADRLVERGNEVILLDDLSTGRLSNIDHLNGRSDTEFVLGSILDADLVDHVVSKVDMVYHLAAAVGVNLIVEKPLESLITNIRGTETVVEKAHKHNKRLLVTSTSEIYGKNTSDRLGEEDARTLQVVKLRFFGGLTVEETAEAMGISPRTVKREWSFGRAWLKAALEAKAKTSDGQGESDGESQNGTRPAKKAKTKAVGTN